MGTMVIGGLILSTLLTLLIVPAGFSLADGIEKRVGPWLRRKVLTYKAQAMTGTTGRGSRSCRVNSETPQISATLLRQERRGYPARPCSAAA